MIRTCRCRNDLCETVSGALETGSHYNEPWRKVKNIQECSKGITGHISNLGLVHEGLVEEVCGILLLDLFLVLFLIPFSALRLLLLHGCTRDVEAHLDQLIGPGGSLAASVLRASCRLSIDTICLSCRERKLYRHLILASKVGVGYFGVRNLESGSVLDVERQFGLGEVCLAPVPSS